MKNKLFCIALLSLLTISVHSQTPGNSLYFDGTNDYVTATLPALFTNLTANEFTVEVWIKPQASTFSRVLFAQSSITSFFSLTLSATRQVYFYLNNTVGLVSSGTLALGQWSHVTCTWKPITQEAKIYINGILQPTTSGGSSSTGTSNVMAIGGRTDGNQYFTGELDELRIWSVVRSQCDLDISRNAEYTVAQPNLVAYYKFNQGVAGGSNTTVTTLNDFTNNQNGTLNNFALTGTTSNWVASGAVINQANPNAAITSTDVITACDSIVWINGITYKANNNTATHTLPSSLGCDSVITLNLTVNYSSGSTDTHTACDSFVWINGTTYTASNTTATHKLSTIHNCDSIITLNLTINTVDVGVTVTDPVITANETGAAYQWLDCNQNYAVLPGDTLQVFKAKTNGAYAVEVKKNGCTDTSVCVNIVTTGIISPEIFRGVSCYPNPNQGVVYANLGNLKDVCLKVFTIHGQLVYQAEHINNPVYSFAFPNPSGVYVLEISAQGKSQRNRMVKD